MLNYPKKLWILAIAAAINITGFSFIWPLTTIYITQVFHRTLSVAGLVMMLQAGAGIVGSFLGGIMYDRFGSRTTQLTTSLISALCTLSLALFTSWEVFILMMMSINFLIGVLSTSINAQAGTIWPEGGRKAFNLIYIASNIGVALGCTLGGMVADLSFRYTFAANSLTFILFFLLIWKGMPAESSESDKTASAEEQAANAKEKGLKFTPSFISLLLLSIGMMFCFVCYVQWQSTIPVYMQSLGLSLSSYSLLWTVNGVLIIVLQPLSASLIHRLIPSLPKQLLIGVLLYILAFIVLSLQQSDYRFFMVAMIIMTLGEILVWPGVPAAAAKLATEENQGFYQGMINGFSYGGRMVGPLIGGFLYDHYNPQIMFTVMITFFVLSCLCFSTYHRIKQQAARRLDKTALPPS
ncbi:MDR family MFS transporter [Brevibacillus ginsengisoli]|uniref:MDR family MFS transporter n=1 Tax=Brevibacillus ginsengisoli TaxID=363854 RepID=UPI003CE8F779